MFCNFLTLSICVLAVAPLTASDLGSEIDDRIDLMEVALGNDAVDGQFSWAPSSEAGESPGVANPLPHSNDYAIWSRGYFSEAELADPAVSGPLAYSSGNDLDIDSTTPVGTSVLGEPAAIGSGAFFNRDGAIVTPLLLDPTVGDLQFYIDGFLDTLSAAGGTPINSSTANNVRFRASQGIANRSLTGKMDDIRIYTRALPAPGISDLAAPLDRTLGDAGMLLRCWRGQRNGSCCDRVIRRCRQYRRWPGRA